ncbi:AAA family ATPase [Patescibacteria group bacterium]|nr:AAA family ATPase [Patescibacteria group bacterium]
MTQDQSLEILKSGENVFLTGSAGTGKTFLLNQFIKYLRKEKIPVGITASTGISAIHLGGITIHSWSGIGIKKNLSDLEIKKLVKKRKLVKRIRDTKILIIDEISMFDAQRLDLVDRICRATKDPFRAFGGLQVIMCGDFFQLPPVDGEREGVKFAYDSRVWQQADLRVCYLDQQQRQKDSVFINILNSIRENRAGEDILNQLKTRLHKSVAWQSNPTKLYTHNVDVDAINDSELSKISETEMTHYMTASGPLDLINALKKGCLAPEILKLKKGALVMFIRNNFDQGYVNGTLGIVVDFNQAGYPIVKIRSGGEIIAVPISWSIEENERVIAHISQVPLRLAWAITVHKSQGMSLDAAEIDLSKSFVYGMGYVALSRVKELDGIRLMGINNAALRVNPEIVEKDREFRRWSEI